MKKGRPLRVAFLKVEYKKGEELEQDRSRYSKACFFFFLFFFLFSFVLPLLVLVIKCPEIKVLIKKIQQAMISLHRMAVKGVYGEFCFILVFSFRSYLMTPFFGVFS